MPLEGEELVEAEAVIDGEAEDDALALAAARHESEEIVEDEPVGPAPVPEEPTGIEIEVPETDLDAAGERSPRRRRSPRRSRTRSSTRSRRPRGPPHPSPRRPVRSPRRGAPGRLRPFRRSAAAAGTCDGD